MNSIAEDIARSQRAIKRSQAARARAAKTVAMAKWIDLLRSAHADGNHENQDGQVDPTGYWAEQGCPVCCTEVIS